MTTRHPALRLTAALAAVGLLALTACSGDDAKTGPDGTTTSPLGEYFAEIDSTYDEAEGQRQQVEMENLVAECMVDAGFEYIPQDYSSSFTAFDPEDAEDQNTEEWVTKNGYGMYYDAETEEGDEGEEGPVDEWVDPNADYVASLSESAQVAFYEALNGPDVWSDMTEEEMETYEWNWEDGGCYGWASNEVYPESGGTDAEFEPLFDAFEEMYESQMNAPELKTLHSEWSSCMADAGYTGFATPDDAQTAVMDEYNALYEDLGEPENPEDPNAVWPEPSTEDRKAAKQNDIETALADFRCKESVDWTEREQKVTFAIEEQFIKDHQAELEAYKASMMEESAAS